MPAAGLKQRRSGDNHRADIAEAARSSNDDIHNWEEDPLRLRSPAPSEPRDSPKRGVESIRPTDTTLHLYEYQDAPAWARGNPFILRGYRAKYTMSMCLRSIFTIHNETGNVWTHLLGMLFFLACSVMFFSQVMKPMLVHYVVLIPFSFACVACMGLSAAYHLFSCHYCERVHDKMMQWDYFGITCLIVGSFLPPCYYAFQCEPMLRLLYLSMIGVLGSVGLVGPFFGFWAQERYYWLRLVVYCSVAGSGIFPVVHVNFVLPNGTARPYVFGLAIMMLLYFVGMMIYIFKVPERWFPGRFDIWLHSHQLWHVFVLCAALVHFFNSGSMYLQLEPMEVHC
jgi:adiponectin receptor